MARVVQNEDLARQLTGAGPCLQVFVELTPDATNGQRLPWSSAAGRRLQLYSGMPCQASVVLGEERPIQLVFPGLGRAEARAVT